jgi:hypothetical protein
MSERARKVGVIVREPASEQLRMATGLTAIHDNIVVLIADHILEPDVVAAEHIEAMRLMGVRLLTNMEENPFEYMEDNLIARVLAECDIVLS